MKKTIFWLILTAFALSAHAATEVHMRTSMGDIELILDEERAPKTVANFVRYAQKGFYDNTVFHRVIPGFMIQGGGFTADMKQKPVDPPIPSEADNGLLNYVGTVAMARTSDPDSATSQFFINVNSNDSLNYRSPIPRDAGYTVFGRVTKGMDVVNKIAAVPTTVRGIHRDVPKKAVRILSVTVKNKEAKHD